MLFTGQEYCKIVNKNALPCIHGVLLAVCTLTLLSGTFEVDNS